MMSEALTDNELFQMLSPECQSLAKRLAYDLNISPEAAWKILVKRAKVKAQLTK